MEGLQPPPPPPHLISSHSYYYGQIKEAFSARTEDDIFQLYIPDKDFRSSNYGNDIGYNSYVFDKKDQ